MLSPVMQIGTPNARRLSCIVGRPSDGGLTRTFSETYNPRDNAEAAFLIVG
jgi:hypothetical protein